MESNLPNFDKDFVESLIPQRFPFVMVGEVSDYSENHVVSGFTGSIPKLGGYAKSLDNLNKKNALSRTPLSCNLKFFILALNDSAEALVLLLSK